MTYEELAQAYVALCEHVAGQALRISAYGMGGKAEKAGVLALQLSDEACDRKQQFLMLAEQKAGTFDLAALHQEFGEEKA